MNRSARVADLPTIQADKGISGRIWLLGLQSKQADGKWTYLAQASLYDTGMVGHAPCTALPRGGTADFTSVALGVPLLRKQVAGLGDHSTMRLNLMLSCRKPDGTVLNTPVTTEDFGLRLSVER